MQDKKPWEIGEENTETYSKGEKRGIYGCETSINAASERNPKAD